MNLFLCSLWKKKLVLSFGHGLGFAWDERQRSGLIFEPKTSWHSMKKKPHEMRQGGLCAQHSNQSHRLGHQGSKEQWRWCWKCSVAGVLRSVLGKSELTVLVQESNIIRTGLWRDWSDNNVENELGEGTEGTEMLMEGINVKPREGLN